MSEPGSQMPGAMDAMARPDLIPSEYLQKWQSLVDLMAQLCEVPAGLIMRTLPSQIEVLIASHTAGNPYMPHHKADLGTGLYCETVMKSGKPLLVPNALEDIVWNMNPDLELGMIAYLGIPLYWEERELFGTICVLDDKTRKFAARYVDLLWHFKDVIENDFRQIQRTRALEAEQAHLQEVFLRSEQQQRQFFETFPGMAMLVSDAGRCLAINQRGSQMVDCPADVICGAHLQEVLTDAGWATLAPLVGRAVSGEAIIKDAALPLLGGRRRVQLVCVPHDDAASGFKGTYLFVVDQEAQKAAEEALCLSESRLQETQAIAHLGMWELELVGNRLAWSDETFRIFELDPTQMEPSYDVFINSVHPDDRAWVNDSFRQSLETRTPYEIVHRLQMPDGRIKSVQCRSQTFYDGKGRPQRVMGTLQDVTARKQVEEALRASEERFRAAYRNAAVGMSIADLSGRICEVNHALCTILGYSEQELRTLTFQALTHPDDLGQNLERVRSLLTDETAFEVLEKRYLRKDGSIVWGQVGISLIRDAAGMPLYILAMVQDITTRKRAEEALLASQRRFDLAVQGSQTGIWDWDMRTNQAYFSPPWKQQLGYEDQELPSLPEEWYARQHPDDRARVAETLRAYLDGETEQYEVEHRLRHKDGSYRWILARGVALRDAQGKPTRMAGSHVDITDRKRMELALRESEERFNYVTEATNDGIWDWDIQTGRVYFSPQWLRLLAYLPEEVPPSVQFFFDMLHPNDAARMTEVLHAHMDGHLPVMELELRLRTKSGAYRWFLDRGKVVTRSQDGSPLRMVGTITDITDRKQAEQALRLTRFSIEHAVDAVLWIAASGRILDVNKAACVMLGYAREELLSKTVYDIGLSVSAEAWSAHWEDVKARTSFSFEGECRKKDGTVIQIEKTVNFLIHEGEEYNCAFIRDVTESKRAQSRLRATQYAVDHATDSLFVINMNGQFVDVNESACTGLGYTKEELLTKTVMDIDPDWSLSALQTFWEEFRNTKFVRLEARHRTKSGVIYPVEIVTNFIVHEGQELNYAFVRDISVRKKAEAFAEAQRTVLGLMAKDAPLSDILASLCLETEKQSDGMLCSVLLLEGTVLCHAVAPSLPDEYTSAINGVTIGPEVGSCGAAAYKNETVIVADIATDPLWDDYREMALREGLKTCWSTPIRDAAGSVLGVFAVYRRTAVAPDAAQEELINMSVYLAGIAIERRRAEESLRLVKFSVDHATDAMYWVGSGAELLDVNETACSMLGYTKEEFSQMTVLDINPNLQGLPWPIRWEETSRKGTMSIETTHRTKDGRLIPVEVRVNVLNYQGVECHCAFVRDITLRKLAEEELRRNEELFRVAYHNAAVGMALCNLRGRFLEINAAFCEILGYSEEDLRERDFKSVTYPADVADSVKWVRQLVDGQITQKLFEKRYVRKNGEIVWANLGLSAIRDGAGVVTNIMAMAQDITTRKLAEEELRRSEELFRVAYQNAAVGMAICDLHGRFLESNAAFCEILGYSEEDLRERDFRSVTYPADVADSVKWVRQLVDGQITQKLFEKRYVRKSGEIVWANLGLSAIRDGAGVVTNIMAMAQDITTRKLAEEELRRSEELFRVAYQNAAVGMAICDLHGRFLEINPAYCEILGYSEEELRERDFKSVTYPADISDSVNWVHQVVNGQISQKLFEKRYVRKNGEIVWANLGLSVLRDGAGAVVKMLAMVQDTTARKKAEQVLRASEQRLIEAQSVASLGSWSWDIPEDTHQWSDEQYRILGFVPGSIRPAFEVFAHSLHPDDRVAVVATIQAAIHGDAGFDLTCRIVRPDGEIRYVHCRGEVVRSQLGAPLSMIGTVQDSTRQKRTEAMLRVVASEPARFGETKFLGSMLRTLAEGTGAIFAFCGRVLPGGQRVHTVAVWSHGAEAENMAYDLVGTPCKPVVTSSSCVHETGVREKFPTDVLLQDLGADSYIGTPLFGSDDQPIGILAIIGSQPFEDVEHAKTLLQICAGRAGSELERRQIEKVLQSSEERFRLVAEATQDVLWDWNVVTDERWWSPNAGEKFRYDSRLEGSMDAWSRRLHPEDKARILTMMKQTVQSDMRSFSAEYRFQLADGSYGHFLDRAHIVRNKSGAALRMIGAMIDVTGPRLAYASLEEAYRRLQAMSQELQMVESNERRRLSRELHDEIGQLLTSLKFDLAAFNRSLAGPSRAVSKRSQERLTRALETTDLLFTRLRQVVRALRPPVLEELGLKAGLEALLADVHARTGLQCSLRFEEGDSRAGRFPTLETAFYRIVQELLTNVVRHAKAKTVSVTLMPGRQEWRMTVKDNGIGFDVTKLFPTGGFGLRGIRERVEILAGQVEIVSSPESGTCVEVRIPVGRKSNDAPRELKRALSPRRRRNTVHE